MPKDNRLTQAKRKKAESHSPDAPKAAAEATGQEEEKRLNVRVPAGLYDQFREMTEQEGRNMSWYVKQWIKDYVSTGKSE